MTYRRYPWLKEIRLDEHKFKEDPKYWSPQIATVVVDRTNKRVFDLVEGRSMDELNAALYQILGRKNFEASKQ